MNKRSKIKRRRLLKRFRIGAWSVVVSLLVGPVALSLLKYFSDEEFLSGVCDVSPNPYPLALIVLISLCVWFVYFAPIPLGMIKNAIYVRFALWSLGIIALLQFQSMSLIAVECWQLTSISTFLSYALPLSFVGAFGFVWLMRARLKRVIEVNSHAFNFEKMQWDLTVGMVHIDENANSSQIAIMLAIGGFVGLLLAGLPWSAWFEFSETVNHWSLAMLFWLVGWATAYAYGGSDLYIMWRVWRRSRQEGRPMLAAELA